MIKKIISINIFIFSVIVANLIKLSLKITLQLIKLSLKITLKLVKLNLKIIISFFYLDF